MMQVCMMPCQNIKQREVLTNSNLNLPLFQESLQSEASGLSLVTVQDQAKRFLNKYFLEGQKLNETQTKALAELDPNAPWNEKLMVKYRKTLGVLIPFCFYQICWWCLAFKHDFFSLFPQRWILSVTMIFGATVAG